MLDLASEDWSCWNQLLKRDCKLYLTDLMLLVHYSICLTNVIYFWCGSRPLSLKNSSKGLQMFPFKDVLKLSLIILLRVRALGILCFTWMVPIVQKVWRHVQNGFAEQPKKIITLHITRL